MYFDILYEDNHLIVVNKKSGVLVQDDNTGDPSLLYLLKIYLKNTYNKKGNVFLGLVHRIDRPVSGIVIFAKTSKALRRLNQYLKFREIKKKYLAIVCGAVNKNSQKLENWILKKTKQNKSYVYIKKVDRSKKAILNYKVLHSYKNYTLLEIDLETGRHHQIRAQLAYIGFPIKGDLKYGAPRSNKNKAIDLHSKSIEFIHPTKKNVIKLIAENPKGVLWNASPSC